MYHGIPWYFGPMDMVYHGIPWYIYHTFTMVYHGTFTILLPSWFTSNLPHIYHSLHFALHALTTFKSHTVSPHIYHKNFDENGYLIS